MFRDDADVGVRVVAAKSVKGKNIDRYQSGICVIFCVVIIIHLGFIWSCWTDRAKVSMLLAHRSLEHLYVHTHTHRVPSV